MSGGIAAAAVRECPHKIVDYEDYADAQLRNQKAVGEKRSVAADNLERNREDEDDSGHKQDEVPYGRGFSIQSLFCLHIVIFFACERSKRMPRRHFCTRFAMQGVCRTKKMTLMKPCKKQHEVCNECEQEFIDAMNRLVGTVEGYTHKRHFKKEHEVEAAFGRKQKEPAEQ